MVGKMDWAAMGWPTEGKAAECPHAGDVARKGMPTCRLDERVGNVRARAEEAGWNMCLVVNEAGVLLGRLRERVLDGDPEAIVEAVMEEGTTTIRPNAELEEIIGRMQKRKVGTIAVTRADGTLIGILYRQDGEERLAE
ncbi:MAG: CBS domain-containing protein [bacterium]